MEALPDWRLRVAFLDGTAGFVEMNGLVHSDDAGVFAALRDPNVFGQATLELGAVVWPTGQDLAPDAMYAAIKAQGVWTI